MSMTMALPVIRVAVASPPSVFFLRNVLVGLSGVRVQNLDRWLRVLSTEGIYSEEDFEWIVAGLLPCPRSFFKVVYSNNGELQVIFAARPASIANRFMGLPGYCCCCYSPISDRYSRSPHEKVHSWVPVSYPEGDSRLIVCVVCYDSNAYINIDAHASDLNRHEQVYLDRIGLFYDAADATDSLDCAFAV